MSELRLPGHGARGGHHQPPFYCPYCSDEDLQPQEEHGAWLCGSCRRAFVLRFIGIGVRA